MTTISSPFSVTANVQVDAPSAPALGAQSRLSVSADSISTPDQPHLSSLAQTRHTLATYHEAAAKLRDAVTWASNHAHSSAPGVVIAHSTGAPEGAYQVQVNSLATAQTSVSAPVADSTANLALNTIHIQVGTWSTSPNTFTSNPIWPRSSIVVGPGDTSLQDVRDKINAASIGGVVATVISDSTGSRLVLSARDTGTPHGFQVSTDNAEDILQLQHQFAEDATGTINGQAVSSARNTIVNAVPGLNLKFQQVSSQAVNISVGPDSEGIVRALSDVSQAVSKLSLRAPELRSTALKAAPELRYELSEIGLMWSGDGSLNLNTQRLHGALQAGDLDLVSKRVTNLLDHLDVGIGALPDQATPGIDSPWLAQYLSMENNGN